ncbi:DUF4434 domain-containing protein, partial [Xanthomonas sp. Kuri4-1]
MGLLPGCARPPHFDGSFLQPWQSHLALGPDDWRRHMALARQLGCRELVLQWSGLYGGDEPEWTVPDAVLRMIFASAHAAGLRVRVGVPYHRGWWKALQATEDAPLDAFLALTRERALSDLQQAPWPSLPGFAGWYLPYELEQYHWATEARQQRLCDWLQPLCLAAAQHSPGPMAVSTYFSRLPTRGSLSQLWTRVLDRVAVRPMVQDGVGVAGLGNLAGVDPLLALLRARAVAFDVVVELFEELPSSAADGSHFQAQTADVARIRQQLDWAQGSGADGLFAFALDPWLSQDTPRARALRRQWRA